MAHTTGLGWDPRLQTYTTSDEFWEHNTKRNKEKMTLWFAPPANLKELEIMFQKSKVSGLSVCIPGQAEANNPTNFDDMDTPEAEWVEEEIPNHSTYTERAASQGGKRKAQSQGKNPMVRVMSKMVEDVISTNSVTSKTIQGNFTRDEIREVMKLAKESGAVEGSDEHYIATRLFVKSKN